MSYIMSEENCSLLKLDSELSYYKDEILSSMIKNNLEKINVFDTMTDRDTGYFYCKKNDDCFPIFNEEGIRTCGKDCNKYIPKNGKCGQCKYKEQSLLPKDEYILYISGKLEKV